MNMMARIEGTGDHANRRRGRANWGNMLALLTIAMTVSSSSADESSRKHELTDGNVRVVIEPWRNGVSIYAGEIVVSSRSNIVITTPGWAPHYYLGPNIAAVESAVFSKEDGTKTLRFKHVGKEDSFLGDETISLSKPGRIEFSFHGRFTPSEGQAMIQWRMASLNPTLIVGMPYRAHLKSGEVRKGIVPVSAESAEPVASTLAQGFDWIEFDSRIGLIRIEVETDRDLICYDFRKNRWADPTKPLFWFGDLGSYFSKQTALDYRVVFQLPDLEESGHGERAVRATMKTARCNPVQVYPEEDPPTIVPRPKEAEFADGAFLLPTHDQNNAGSSTLHISISADVSKAAVEPATGELRRFLGERPTKPISVNIDETNPGTSPVRFESLSEDAVLPAEGYELQVDAGGIIIRAADTRGFLYGVQTLKQLFHVEPDGTSSFHAAKIRDWPSMSFRGVHMFTGGQGADLHEKLIGKVLAALKMNHLVLEAEYVEWDSHPEIHHPDYGMPKQEARRIVEVCRELAVEISPMINSLGHCQWMFTNGQNLDLAEDPEARWAYCVTNPKTYEFLFEIYQEAVELFEPRWFHIGHDEFTHRGRYPYREESLKYTADELLMIDTLRLHEWLGERGLRMMMWGDMLLGKGEGPDACNADTVEAAAALREQLPDDILITDWHYIGSPAEKHTSPDKFHSAGLQTVAATWQNPGNIVGFTQAAYEQKSLGLLQTTWAGYTLDPDSFARALPQYAAYVLAAECAWNADRLPDPITYPTGMHFLRLMDLSSLRPMIRAGWTCELSGVVNYPLTAGETHDWFGLGGEHDLSMLPGGVVALRGIKFDLCNQHGDSAPLAIVLQSKLTRGSEFPTAVTLGLGEQAAQVALLHATNFPCARGKQVGEYEFSYTDGQSEVVDLIYGENVFAYTDRSSAPAAPIAWTGTTRKGQAVALRVLLWDNPHPEKSIASITARSANATGSLMLIGLTGFDSTTTDSAE